MNAVEKPKAKLSVTLGEPSIQLTKRGLTFTRAIPIDEWLAFGKKLKTVEAAIQWWVGDWLNYGEKAYGEKYTEALEATEYDEGSLRTMKWVSGAIAMSLRRDNLSWSHHKEVAGLEPERQTKLLDWAEQEKISVKDLRAEIRGKAEHLELHPLEELQKQLLVLRPAYHDRNGQENLFVRALENAQHASITDERVELARVVIDRLRAVASELVGCAEEIEKKIRAAKAA